MPYYLKIAYHSKCKKFIVNNPKTVNLVQIKNTFMPPIPLALDFTYSVTKPNGLVINLNSDIEFINFLKNNEFPDKSSLRITMEEKDSEDEELEEAMLQIIAKRSRSKSEEISQQCTTADFDIEATQ